MKESEHFCVLFLTAIFANPFPVVFETYFALYYLICVAPIT